MAQWKEHLIIDIHYSYRCVIPIVTIRSICKTIVLLLSRITWFQSTTSGFCAGPCSAGLQTLGCVLRIAFVLCFIFFFCWKTIGKRSQTCPSLMDQPIGEMCLQPRSSGISLVILLKQFSCCWCGMKPFTEEINPLTARVSHLSFRNTHVHTRVKTHNFAMPVMFSKSSRLGNCQNTGKRPPFTSDIKISLIRPQAVVK